MTGDLEWLAGEAAEHLGAMITPFLRNILSLETMQWSYLFVCL